MTAAPVPPPRWGPQRARATSGAGVPAPSSEPGRQWAHNTRLVNRLMDAYLCALGEGLEWRGHRSEVGSLGWDLGPPVPLPRGGAGGDAEGSTQPGPCGRGHLPSPLNPPTGHPGGSGPGRTAQPRAMCRARSWQLGTLPPIPAHPPIHPGESSPSGLSRLSFCVQHPWPRPAWGEGQGPHFTLS